MRMIKSLNLFSLLIFIVYWGCSEPAETPTKGKILVGVDESVYKLLDTERNTFQSKYPDSKIEIEKINLHDGMVNFLNGKYKMFVSSKNFNKKESDFIKNQKLYVRTFKFCYDGIAAVTSKKNIINRISVDQI